MTEPLRVSVVVPTYRRHHDLQRCLEALAHQRRPPDQVVVVSRTTDPESSRLSGSCANGLAVESVQVDAPGVVAALNAGLETAVGDIVCFTDDDCRPRSDWVESIAASFAANPRLGGLGGRDVIHQNGSVVEDHAERVGRFTWFGRYTGNHHAHAPAQRVQFLKGANMSFRRRAAPRFDERLLGRGAQVWNDLQVSLAVARAGWEVIWDPAVTVDHYPAERLDDDKRRRRSRDAIVAHHHNEAYISLRELGFPKNFVVLAYALLVGTRAAPGLAHLVLSLARTPAAAAWRKYAAVTHGRLLGIRTYGRAVREGDAAPSRPM